MRNVIALLALGALFTSGCAGPEQKLGRGISNTFEIVRAGEMRRSIEQTAVFESPSAGYTVGAIRGLDRTVTRIRHHPRQLSKDRAQQLKWELRVKESLADPSLEMRRALGNLHHRLAYEYRRLGDRRSWRRHALQAIRFTPAFWNNWVYLLLSFLG